MNEYIERKAVVEKLNAIGGCDAAAVSQMRNVLTFGIIPIK